MIPPATIPSIIGNLLPSIYNPNLVSEETSLSVAVVELEAASIAADLVGDDPMKAAILFSMRNTSTPYWIRSRGRGRLSRRELAVSGGFRGRFLKKKRGSSPTNPFWQKDARSDGGSITGRISGQTLDSSLVR